MNRTLALVLLSLAACKAKVDTAGFEKTIQERTVAMGLTASTVTCPKDVEAKKDAKFTCQVAIEKSTYDLVVTITNVDKDSKRVDMDTAWAKGPAVIAKKIAGGVPKSVPEAIGAPVTVDCGTEPLLFLEAGKAKCKLTTGKQTVGMVFTFDDKYNVTNWELEPKMLVRKTMEGLLTKSVAEKVPNATVSCGTDDLVARPPDGIILCEATDGAKKGKIKVVTTPDLVIERWEAVN